MNGRLLIVIDRFAKPFYFVLNILKFGRKKNVADPSFIVLKFFGIGSLTRIAHVINQTGIKKSDVIFITLKRNKAIIDLLGLHAKYINLKNPFIFLGSAISVINNVWRLKKKIVLDMERASNLSGIFRLIISIGKSCSSFHFKPENYSRQNQLFISLHQKPAVNAIAEMFGKPLDKQLKNQTTTTIDNRIIVNVNAGDYLPERKFTKSEYIQLLKVLHDKNPEWEFELSGVKSELSVVELFKDLMIENGILDKNISVIAGKHDLASFVTRLKTATLFISNDSGPMHLAYYFGVKTVAIWGPTSPTLVGYGNNDQLLNLAPDISCSPCFEHPKSKVAKACNGELTCFKSMMPSEMALKISRFVDINITEAII